MENASDAFKMAFAVMIFIFALTLAFSTITKAKNTADIVLFVNDETNYQTDISTVERNNLSNRGRNVNINTVISTLYRCKNETMVVNVIEDSNTFTFDSVEDQGALSEKIRGFVQGHIGTTNTYLEQFVEAKYSGREITADDGSSIIVTKGGSKMYITYTRQ